MGLFVYTPLSGSKGMDKNGRKDTHVAMDFVQHDLILLINNPWLKIRNRYI